MQNATPGLSGKATFGELLRRQRRAARLSQEELAERAELSPRGLRYLEHGSRAPYPDTVRRLIAALELPQGEAEELTAAARAHRGGAALRPAAPPPHGDIIGRERELAVAGELLLGRCRLLTVLGAGGVGKTRFAIELTETASGTQFTDGAAWVPLAGVGVAEEVPAAILAALGWAEAGGRNESDSVLARLQNGRLLLVLDNFEHVTGAAGLVSELIAACPGVKVLVTSRAPLRLAAEQEFWLGPLPLPGPSGPGTPEAIRASPAVQLFAERARAVDRRFGVDETNAADVGELCRQLEGLPLALELAAPRIRTLSPGELVAQLANRLDLLSGGPIDAPARQRSLRSTLDWSYDLLPPHSQLLLRALSVFAGGCTFEAVGAVCVPEGEPSFNLVDTVDALQRNSLVQRVEPPGRKARYSLLETVREYARERLEAEAEAGEVRRRHARYFADLGLTTAAQLDGPGQATAAALLEEEHDNLRAALQWLLEFDAEAALLLAGPLWMFWYMRGFAGEGRRYLTAALEKAPPAPARPARAKALLGAGQLARAQADYVAARALMEECVASYEEVGDPAGRSHALFGTGFVARMQEDYQAADRYFDAALRLSREIGNPYGMALTLHHLGLGASEVEGDLPRARALLDESLALFRSVGFARHVALVLSTLGNVARQENQLGESRDLHSQALKLLLGNGQYVDIHWVLDGMADLAYAEGDVEVSVRIAAAARRLRDRIGDLQWGPVRRRRERWLAAARLAMGRSAFEAAWESGASLSADDAVALVLHGRGLE